LKQSLSILQPYTQTSKPGRKNLYWCSKCKKHTHNTAQCFSLKPKDKLQQTKLDKPTQNKNESSIKKDKKINAINPQNLLKLELISETQGLKTSALLDSGASISTITPKTAKKLNLKIKTTNREKRISLADETIKELNEKVKLKIKLPNEEIVKIRAYLLENSTEDIIFGYNALRKLEIKIDYKNESIYILDKLFENSNKIIIIDKPSKFGNKQLMKILGRYKTNVSHKNPIKDSEMKIELTTDVIPKSKSYSVPANKEKMFKDEINNLLNKGVIEDSTSLYGSPSFLKPKEDGTGRLLIDFKGLNEITKEIQGYFPSIQESFHRMAGSKYFSKIDLERGFYQVALEKESRKYTGFTTPYGKFQCTRTPLGLVNAPKHFQNLVQRILKGIENINIFVDDIIIFTKTEKETIQIIEQIIQKFIEYNIIINFNKSEFLFKKINYLGFELTENGYRPDINRLEDFREWRIPTSKRDLQKVLSKINWYRQFLPQITEKLTIFYDKLKTKEKKISVTPKEMEIIHNLYDDLKNQAKLYFPDMTKEFYINSDASDMGVGAILYQKEGVISHFSKKLNKHQQRYSATEKEMFAVYLAVNHWKKWLIGSKIIVLTDNKNILGNQNDYDKKTARWKAELNEFNITMNHIAGIENNISDELSRKKSPLETLAIMNKEPENREQIKKLLEFHYTNGHPGWKATFETLKLQKKIQKPKKMLLENLIRTCGHCQRNKRGKECGELTGNLHSETPFMHLSTDVYGPFHGNQFMHTFSKNEIFIITIIDRSSRMTKISFTDNITAYSFIKMLTNEWLSEFKNPKTILSDQGKCYTADATKAFLKEKKIKQIFASTYNPTGNGISERINQTISTVLRIYKGWDLKLLKIVLENRLNNIFHYGIKMIPTEAAKLPSIDRVEENRNEKRRINHIYKCNDEILIKNTRKKTKLDPFFIEPS
ncbi:pol polyprotein, partial [Pseudoloma neurophilia]